MSPMTIARTEAHGATKVAILAATTAADVADLIHIYNIVRGT
jgi:hypothetical protein